MNSGISCWKAFKVPSDRHLGACIRASDLDRKCEVGGRVYCQLPLILMASLGLAQKLPQLESH